MSICYIHDDMYLHGDPTIECFDAIQEAFFNNMTAAVFAQIKDRTGKRDNQDLFQCVIYYSAVEASSKSYWRVKRLQGHTVPV